MCQADHIGDNVIMKCDLTRDGDSEAAEAVAIFDPSGTICDDGTATFHDYCIWGTNGNGYDEDEICTGDQHDVANGGAAPDDICLGYGNDIGRGGADNDFIDWGLDEGTAVDGEGGYDSCVDYTHVDVDCEAELSGCWITCPASPGS